MADHKNEEYLARLGRELDRLQAFSVEQTRTWQQLDIYAKLGISEQEIERQVLHDMAFQFALYFISTNAIAVTRKEADDKVKWTGQILVSMPDKEDINA